MDWKSSLPVVGKFIEWASPKKIFLLAFAGFVGIVLYTSYGRRADLGAFLVQALGNNSAEQAREIPELEINLTPDIKARIKTLVDSSSDINYLGVVSANIRINQRELINFYSNDQVITEEMKAGKWHEGSTQPIFTSSETGNEQMVAVINGEFGCYKFEDTINFIAVPKLMPKMPYFCGISMPPYYGEFSGYLAIGLKQKPDESKQNEVRIEAVRLSTEIYFKSIAKNRRG